MTDVGHASTERELTSCPTATDRYLYLHCDGAPGATAVARKTEESEPGDGEMGTLQHSGAFCQARDRYEVGCLTCAKRTVKFINDEASSIHGNLKVASVYTSESGEWKLGGFEVLSNVKDDDAIIYVCAAELTCSRH